MRTNEEMEAAYREELVALGLTPGRRRGYVEAPPVIAHVMKLRALGWTFERISRTANLATSSVRQMIRQNNETVMDYRAAAIMRIPLDSFRWKYQTHGELACFHAGCRCDLCRETNKRHMKEWHRSRNQSKRLVAAEPIRAELQAAIDSGWTSWAKIHRAIGGSGRTLTMLLAGRYAMLRQPTVKRIRAHLRDCRADQQKISALVEDCLVCGWPLDLHRPYYQHVSPYRPIAQTPDQRRGTVAARGYARKTS